MQPVTAWQNTYQAYNAAWGNKTKWKIKSASTTRSTADQTSQEHTPEAKRGYGADSNISRDAVYVKAEESLTPEVTTAKGAGKIVNVNPATGCGGSSPRS